MNTRVAVIGVGALGRHHARILAALPGVDLVGIVDVNEPRAREIGSLVNAPSFSSAAEMLGHVDAVTVAVPTEAHLSVSLPFLQRGIGCWWRSRSREMPVRHRR